MDQARTRSSVGGAANWGGTTHECGVAAFLAVHCLADHPVKRFGLPPQDAVPLAIRLQADEPVDDIVCELSGGGAAYLQAKTRLQSQRSFRSVVAQWTRFGEARKLDPQRDRLIAVAETASGPLETLDRFLQRGRRSRRQRDMDAEKNALAKLDALLGQMSVSRKIAIKRCARIWLESFDDDGDTTVDLAMMLLRPVVGVGRESEAWHRLLKVMGDGARLRVGYNAEDLRDELRLVGIDLADDPPGSPGAARAALVRYRQRLADRARILPFTGLGASIPEVSVEIGDAHVKAAEQAVDGTDEPTWSAELHWWIRRRGRLVLTGLPGSGKSTALRIAAGFYAKTRGWPLPILVPLDRLAKRVATQSFRDALLELATEDASHADRATLRTTLDDAIEAGEVLLAFDGLDEAGQRRHDVVRQLQGFLRDLDPALEVVVSTRDSAYAEARALGFREVRLLPPQDMSRTVEAVLEQLAAARGVAESESAAWVAERVSWVTSALGTNTPLQETPLVGVLLAVLASTSATGRLPTRRGAILWDVVRAVAARWEFAKGADAHTIGVLTGTRARRALEDAYISIAATLVSTELPPVSEVVQAVAELLGEVMTLAPAEADVAAEDAVAFWDRSGFFVARGHEDQLSPRLRLFAEIGEARRLTSLEDDDLRRWIASAVNAEDRHEILRLTCELEARAAEMAIEVAAPQHALLATGCAERAASLSKAGRARLIDLLVELWEADEQRRWETVDELIRLARTAEQRRRVRQTLERLLPPKQFAVATAAAALEWDEHGRQADAALTAVFDITSVERSTTEPHGLLSRMAAEQIRVRTLVGAARRLIPSDRALAERLVQNQPEGLAATAEIRQIAVDAGFADVVPPQIRRGEESAPEPSRAFLRRFDESLAAERVFLEWIASSTDHISLTFAERRRLDDLIDYWTSIGIGSTAAFEPSDVYRLHPDLLHDVLLVLLKLSGVHQGRAATQAAVLLDESAGQSRDGRAATQMLYMDGDDLLFDCWNDLADADRAREVLFSALGVGRWLPALAASALSHSVMSEFEQQDLERALRSLPRPYQRTYAGMIRLELANDKQRVAEVFLAGDDPALRSAAAAYVADEMSNPKFARLISELLDDPDDEVRSEFVTDLARTSPSGEVLATVEAADWTPRPWQCSSCGADNPPGGRGCQKCRTTGGETIRALHTLRDRVSA